MTCFFRKTLQVLLCAAGLLAPSLTQASAQARNEPIAGGGKPWWGRGEGVSRQSVDGKRAIALRAGFVVQEQIPVSGGRNYRLSMSMLGREAPEASLYVQASFRGPGVSTQWAGIRNVQVNDKQVSFCLPGQTIPQRREKAMLVQEGGEPAWQRQTVVFTAPPNARELVLYLRKAGCTSGTGYYADISLEETDEPATSISQVLAARFAEERLQPPGEESPNAALLDRQIRDLRTEPRTHWLARDGAMAAQVHVGADESLMVLQSAADLADFSARIAGAAQGALLSNDRAVASGPLLVVGRDNALAQAAFRPDEFEGLGDDGFLIRSFGPHILIAGATERGTMYGVNWFLDRKLGIRWLAPDATFVPHRPDLSLAPVAERQVPRFSFRAVLNVEGEDKAWRQRNLMNGESHGPSFQPSPPQIDSWNRRWASKGLIANFYELLPPKQYREQHPEWYAGGQLAMMNTEMRAEMAKVVIERLRALPDYRDVWFSIHDMDRGWDMDAESAAFARRHGNAPSAPRLDMMIDIAERVRAELPGARLAFNPYHWSFTPPQGMTVPDHILVYPMTIHVNYAEALNEPANAKLGQDIAGWNRIGRHVIVWDHITNFAGFIQPTPNILPIGRSIRWLATLENVEGYMGEGSFNTPGAEFAALRAWMISRLLWDPTEDPDTLVAEFCDRYYGPAAGPVLDYIRFIHEKIGRSGDVLAEKTTVDMAMFDAEFVRRAEALFDAAETAAAGTPFLKRVRAARMPVDYVIILRRAEYAARKQEIGFDVMATMAERRARFEETLQAEGVRHYLQARGNGIPQLKALMDVERKPAPIPDIAQDAEGWSDIQDLSFQRFAGDRSMIVTDPLASDGAAIALERTSTGWITQLKLDKLPRQGRWWLYAALRAEGGAENAAIARLGSAPPMNCAVEVRNTADLADGYRWFEVPGGPFTYSTDHSLSVYLQPIRGQAGERVLIDRIVALADRPDLPSVVASGRKCR